MKLIRDHNRTVFVPGNFAQILIVHLVVFGAAPFLITRPAWRFGLVAAIAFGYALGIFHHMLLSHRSFKAKLWVERLGALLGTLSWRGPFAGPVRYVAMHRIHHRYSDTQYDPHTPVKGLFHAWLGWCWNMPYGFTRPDLYEGYAGRVARDPWLRFMDRHVHLLQAAWGVLCFLTGASLPWFAGGAWDNVNGVRYVVFGVFVKTLILLYLANAVDVINHTLGYRNYQTRDRSTNSMLMAAVHLGGAVSWHNNHHARPRYFYVRKNWWEFDVYYAFLKGLERLKLVSDIKVLDERPAPADEKNAAGIPKRFFEPSRAGTIGLTARALALWTLPSLLMYALLSVPGIAGPTAVALALPLLILAAHGLHNTGLIGHEGTHFNLHRDRFKSAKIGVLISSLVPLHFDVGIAVLHADHHRFTNTDRDPDAILFAKFKSIWSRLLFARIAANRRYLRATLNLALSRWPERAPMRVGLTLPQMERLARLNLAASAACLTLYGLLAYA
ncbi:MAG TPA: fatty acid desaturase, partial [Bdellovibrionales bacterium]|nr:fatty acid desaturase [Bdellovibrionales bacterium]